MSGEVDGEVVVHDRNEVATQVDVELDEFCALNETNINLVNDLVSALKVEGLLSRALQLVTVILWCFRERFPSYKKKYTSNH